MRKVDATGPHDDYVLFARVNHSPMVAQSVIHALAKQSWKGVYVGCKLRGQSIPIGEPGFLAHYLGLTSDTSTCELIFWLTILHLSNKRITTLPQQIK